MRIKYKKSWNPWRQVKDAEEIINFWQDWINSTNEELFRLETALEVINSMRPESRRNTLAHDMADVALGSLMHGVSK